MEIGFQQWLVNPQFNKWIYMKITENCLFIREFTYACICTNFSPSYKSISISNWFSKERILRGHRNWRTWYILPFNETNSGNVRNDSSKIFEKSTLEVVSRKNCYKFTNLFARSARELSKILSQKLHSPQWSSLSGTYVILTRSELWNSDSHFNIRK